MNIGLLDHMGFGNLGDAATQDVVIANIRKRLPNARLVGFSFVPDDTTKRHGIPCYPIRRWYPQPEERNGKQSGDRISSRARLKSTLKNNRLFYAVAKPVLDLAREIVFWARSYARLRNIDLLIISGGGQIDEIWQGPWLQPYTLFKFCLLAKLARTRLYFLNVGAGPLKSPLSRFFAKWAVQFADYRSFRDGESQERMRSLGVKAKTHAHPDLVYGIEIGDELKSAPHVTTRPIVGLNPFRFCHPLLRPLKSEAVYQEYLEKLTQFSSWLLEQGYALRLFTTDKMNDVSAMEELKARLRSRLSPDLALQVSSSVSESVKDVLREMSAFDFVVTSKFHGIIFSQVLGKPVISLSYHKKMDFAMRAVGHERFCADIEGFEVDWLIGAFRKLVEERRSVSFESAEAVRVYGAALSEQFDSLFLPNHLALGPTPDHPYRKEEQIS